MALSVNRIRNNALAQADPAVLLDVMQLLSHVNLRYAKFPAEK